MQKFSLKRLERVGKAAGTGLAIGVGSTAISAVAVTASAAGLVVFSTGFVLNALSTPVWVVLMVGEEIVKELQK